MYVCSLAPYIAAGTSNIVISSSFLETFWGGREVTPLIFAFVIGLDESHFEEDH